MSAKPTPEPLPCPTCNGTGFIWRIATMKLAGRKRYRCDYQEFCSVCGGSGLANAAPPKPLNGSKRPVQPKDEA